MSGSRWDQPGVPHKGWHCVDVVDLRADGGPADETDYATCQMCGNEKIRYVHIMEHPDLDENFEVGCVCAEKMSDDYEGPKRRETKLRNRAVRRTRWLQRKWRVSAKGNSFLNLEGTTWWCIRRRPVAGATRSGTDSVRGHTRQPTKPSWRCSMTSGWRPRMTSICGPVTNQGNRFDVA